MKTAAILITLFLIMPFANAGAPARLIASFHPVNGTNVRGTVVFERSGNKVKVTASVGGLYPKREHHLGIHEFGDLGSPDASSAGGLFRVGEKQTGNLGVLKADLDGNARLSVTLDRVSLGTGASGILGRSVVIRVAPEEDKSPTERLAAGVIGIAFQAESPSPADDEDKEKTRRAE